MAELNLNDLPRSRHAAVDAGSKRYFTGKPCSHGHIAPRLVSSKGCIECSRLAQVKHRAHDAAHRPDRVVATKQRRKMSYFKEKAARFRRITGSQRAWAMDVIVKLRHRARKNGFECTVTPEDLPLPATCPALGIPLVVSSGKNPLARPYTPSVDRIDNRYGYIPGNVCVISTRANLLKKDATLKEMRGVVRYMEEGLGRRNRTEAKYDDRQRCLAFPDASTG